MERSLSVTDKNKIMMDMPEIALAIVYVKKARSYLEWVSRGSTATCPKLLSCPAASIGSSFLRYLRFQKTNPMPSFILRVTQLSTTQDGADQCRSESLMPRNSGSARIRVQEKTLVAPVKLLLAQDGYGKVTLYTLTKLFRIALY